MAGRPLMFKTPKALENKVNAYFRECDRRKKPYTITGLAVYLGTSKQIVCDYGRREGYDRVIAHARARCEAYAEESLFQLRNPSGAMFNLKNNYGWRDQLDIDAKTENKHTFPKLTKKEAENVKKAFDEDF
jgi:hypothetical protein